MQSRVAPHVPDGYPGVVVAVVDKSGHHVFTYGTVADGDTTAPNERTIFEIGSVTKTFTALMLADEVMKGNVALNTHVQALVPTHPIPERGRAITLLDLATHFSSLPRVPDDLPKDWGGRSRYTIDQMYAFLARCQLAADPGTGFAYSNLGYSLLGDAVATHASTTFPAWVDARIGTDLSMQDTRIWLTPEQAGRAAHGRSIDGARLDITLEASSSTITTGGLHTTAADMLRYLDAQLAITHSPLDSAIALSHQDQMKVSHDGQDDGAMALAWHRGVDGTFTKGGATGGFSSFVGFAPAKGVGVAVLTNAASNDTEALGADILSAIP